jgi:putative transposase
MRTPIQDVAAAILMYYEGRSLINIPRVMFQLHQVRITQASVYKWITRFSKIAINETNKIKVSAGDTWIITERVVKVVGKKFWLLDVTDMKNRFLLATKLSRGRSTSDIRSVLVMARDKAGKIPKQILTNYWAGYPYGIELAYGADVKHVRTHKFDDDAKSARVVEHCHNMLKDRMRVMLNLKDREHSQLIVDGWLVHYNYFRPQKALNDKTPAELAKANFKIHSWVDLVNHSKHKAGVIKTKKPRNLRDVINNRVSEIAIQIKENDLSRGPLVVSVPRGAGESIRRRLKRIRASSVGNSMDSIKTVLVKSRQRGT